MEAEDFIVSKRPRLGLITKHRKVEFADYERRLVSMQATLQAIQQAYLGSGERAVVVLEGWDTAGKGGVIRRLGWALDPRSFKVHPIFAPSSHERGQHYLQRFWEKLPEHGQIVVFDRSWYGRVLVERVEGLATTREWRRGYEEINQFERLLVEDGIRIAKIFLHISAGGANSPVQGSADQSAQAVETLLRRFPQSRTMGGLRGGDRRYDGTNVDQTGALVPRAGKRQAVRAACRIYNSHCPSG